MGVAALGVVLLIHGSGQQIKPLKLSALLPSGTVLRGILNRTLVACCLINFVCMTMNNGLMGMLMPLYATGELAFSLAGYGVLVSLSTVGNVFGSLFGGAMSDRLGRRRVLAGGFVIGTLSLVGLALTASFDMMLPLMFLNGLFWGIIYGARAVELWAQSYILPCLHSWRRPTVMWQLSMWER